MIDLIQDFSLITLSIGCVLLARANGHLCEAISLRTHVERLERNR